LKTTSAILIQIVENLENDQQHGAAEARRAHNPEDPVSLPAVNFMIVQTNTSTSDVSKLITTSLTFD